MYHNPHPEVPQTVEEQIELNLYLDTFHQFSTDTPSACHWTLEYHFGLSPVTQHTYHVGHQSQKEAIMYNLKIENRETLSQDRLGLVMMLLLSIYRWSSDFEVHSLRYSNFTTGHLESLCVSLLIKQRTDCVNKGLRCYFTLSFHSQSPGCGVSLSCPPGPVRPCKPAAVVISFLTQFSDVTSLYVNCWNNPVYGLLSEEHQNKPIHFKKATVLRFSLQHRVGNKAEELLLPHPW